MDIISAFQRVIESVRDWINEKLNNKADKSIIGDLSTLRTTNKKDIVTAINELTTSSGGGGGGYTPVRGTDYWTEADIAEIKSYVDSAILGGRW